MKILVIEDQPDVRATLTDILELNGHEVLAAADGEQGVRLAAERPDFIFCDIAMPGLDGYGVLAAVKLLPAVREVPFVFLTAKTEREAQRTGMTLGADDYITKPFSEREILDAIAARCSRYEALRSHVRGLLEARRHEVNAEWAHELLTPLNSVVGCIRLLEQEAGSISRAELASILGMIRQGAERQERLAHQLIRHFELERLKEQPDLLAGGCLCAAPAAVTAGAERAATEAARLADLRLAALPGEVPLPGEYLAYAVYEVARNAFRYSPAGTPVAVEGGRCGDRYRVSLTDAGPGLTAEQRRQVGAFVQFDRSQHEQQGLGLGLTIARDTATLAGGTLRLEEGEAGRGLRVVFDLPAR